MNEYDHTTDWYYEGKISAKLVEYFKKKGFEIEKDNSDNIRARGADIIICKGEIKEAIEVKGYPTKFHTKGKNKGKPKPTDPKLQAKHWFSEAFLSSVFNYKELKNTNPIKISLGFPKFDRYEELITKVEDYFTDNEIDIKVYFVSENGSITTTNLNRKKRK